MTADLDIVPGLVCGQTYRDAATEQGVPNWRIEEVATWSGCGKAMTWLHAYRCRQCARWLHGACIDRHFLTAERRLSPPDVERGVNRDD